MDIVAVDTETLGLKAGFHRVIEVSVARVVANDWGNFTIKTFRFRPRAEDFAVAEPRALEVNGYRPGHPDWEGVPEIQSPEAQAQWAQVLEAVRGARLLCQNVPFDRKMCWAELTLHDVYAPTAGATDLDGPWDAESIEVRKASSYMQKRFGYESASLNPLYRNCETMLGAPQLALQHRSECDVLRALWVWAHAAELQGHEDVPSAAVKTAVAQWNARLSSAGVTTATHFPG